MLRNSLKEIEEALRKHDLYDYYSKKDVDKKDNEDSLFLIDLVVLKDDIDYILSNQEEYDFDDDFEFVEQIKSLKIDIDKI
jgi:hypothetical protein